MEGYATIREIREFASAAVQTRLTRLPLKDRPHLLPMHDLSWASAGPVEPRLELGHLTRCSALGCAAHTVTVVIPLDPSAYAGHWLRAEHATSAAIAGASERSIMNQTGHRSLHMMRSYIREGSLFRENSAGKLGLWLRSLFLFLGGETFQNAADSGHLDL